MNNFSKNLALWIIIGLLLVALFNLFDTSSQRGGQVGVAYSDFLAEVAAGQVREVTIQGRSVTGRYADGRTASGHGCRTWRRGDAGHC